MTKTLVRLHICPLFVDEAQRVVRDLDRGNVQVFALQGGADAPTCRPAIAASPGALDLVVGGPCAQAKLPRGFRPGPELLSCHDALLPSEEVGALLRTGAHLFVPSQLGDEGLPLERWGFPDTELAFDYLREGLTSVAVLDTTRDPSVSERARTLAQSLRRPVTVRPVGLSHLSLVLRLAIAEASAWLEARDSRRRLAEHQLLLELLNELHHAVDFDASLSRVLRTLGGLFGAHVELVELRDPREVRAAAHGLVRTEDGFVLPLRSAAHRVGDLRVSAVTVPTRLDEYLALAMTFAPLLAQSLADRARRELEAGLRLLSHTVFQGTYEGLVVTDPAGTIISVNPSFCALTGYTADELIGQNPRVLKSGRHDDAFYTHLWGTLGATGHWHGEVFNLRKDGTEYRQRLSIGAVRDPEGNPLYYVGAAQDITEEYATREALSHQATHDGLTDLGNRDWLQARLRVALARAEQAGTHVGVCFIDLDRFKLVNDHHGHDAGDALLREVARRLRAAVRHHDGVARVGGDEFVVVVDGLADPAHAYTVAEAVRAALQRPFEWRGADIMTTASVGVVLYPDGAADVDALLTAADDAMYRAKAEGRNRVELHDAEASAARREEDRLRELLRLRLAEAEIAVAFQPIVRIGDGVPVGAEALARMTDNAGVPVSPDRFIPLAEQEGQIAAVGAEVTRKALESAATWPSRLGHAPLYVSINVAGGQLDGALDAAALLEACTAAGVAPERVVLEVVERTVIEPGSAARQTLQSLQATGARLALDDFGTGYSALSYLVDLDASIVKLDRSFVRRLPDDARTAAMVRGLVGLLRHLGHTIVAEGIETEEQRAFLEDAGVQLGQGWLWSRALPSDDFVAWVRARLAT